MARIQKIGAEIKSAFDILSKISLNLSAPTN